MFMLSFNNSHYNPEYKKLIGIFDNLTDMENAFKKAWKQNPHNKKYDVERFEDILQYQQLEAAHDVCYQIESINLNKIENIK